MGDVWLAHDTKLQEQVAIKFLSSRISSDPKALEIMRQETRRSHSLSHPNIVRIHDLYEVSGEQPFITMEYISGVNLHQLARSKPNRRFTWPEIAVWVQSLCTALSYAHSQGIIHRDLKPANLIQCHDGTLKLADFGLAQAIMEPNEDKRISGTLTYMSPQQLAGAPASVTDDIYSLGASLFELLTGRPVYGNDTTESQIRLEPAPLIEGVLPPDTEHPALSEELQDLIQQCLSKDPNNRPQTADDLLRQLKESPESVVKYLTEAKAQFRDQIISALKTALKWGAALAVSGLVALIISAYLRKLGPFQTPPLNLAQARVWASSVNRTEGEPHEPQRAFDGIHFQEGNNHYRWTSEPHFSEIEWIAVDLGKNQRIDWLQVDWETASAANYDIRTRTAEEGFDPDPDTWTERARVVGFRETSTNHSLNSPGNENDVHFNFFLGKTSFPAYTQAKETDIEIGSPIARYVMLRATKHGVNPGVYSLNEIDIGARPLP